MYTRIMVPVDLAHLAHLRKSLDTAADLARHYKIPMSFVGVTAATPSPVAHTPEEFEKKLKAFAMEQAAAANVTIDAVMTISHDPATDVDDALIDAVSKTGADLVVMASHNPGLADYLIPSNGGKVAAHSPASVFVVRD